MEPSDPSSTSPALSETKAPLPVASFASTLRRHSLSLRRDAVTTVQINLGKLCNQACHHCHVDAGPRRTEIMTRATAERVLALIQNSPSVRVIDLTGGAPELNPSFRWLVSQARQLGLEVIDRCNLTVLFEKGQEDTAQFLASHQVRVVASLPCYSKENVEKQRGRGVFAKSIEALRLLNRLGYGAPGTGLMLDLVYNPGGAFLPGPQAKLQEDYKRELKAHFDVDFNRLLTITNMPIRRFLDDLNRQGRYHEYMTLLANSFNAAAVDGVMCRSLVSIGWEGSLYDCDFNQMLSLPLGARRASIEDVTSFEELATQPIALADHCYGCTAGAGSSCGGALT